LQDRTPVAAVSRASRPADSDRWRPSLPPPTAQQRAILTSAQQVADRTQEEHWARLRRQREEFAVQRTPIGASSASSAAAPVEPEPDLWRNYQGVMRRPAAAPGGKGAGKGNAPGHHEEPEDRSKGSGKRGGKFGRGKGGGGRRGGW